MTSTDLFLLTHDTFFKPLCCSMYRVIVLEALVFACVLPKKPVLLKQSHDTKYTYRDGQYDCLQVA